MKKYFIGCLLHSTHGALENKHISITQNLENFFGLPPLHEHIAPHLTFVPPFEITQRDFQYLINELKSGVSTSKVSFMRRTGYLELQHDGGSSYAWHFAPDKDATEVIKKVYDITSSFAQIKKPCHDVIGNLHSTLAKGVEDKLLFSRVKKYIKHHFSDETGEGEIILNKIVFFGKENENWEINKVIRL